MWGDAAHGAPVLPPHLDAGGWWTQCLEVPAEHVAPLVHEMSMVFGLAVLPGMAMVHWIALSCVECPLCMQSPPCMEYHHGRSTHGAWDTNHRPTPGAPGQLQTHGCIAWLHPHHRAELSWCSAQCPAAGQHPSMGLCKVSGNTLPLLLTACPHMHLLPVISPCPIRQPALRFGGESEGLYAPRGHKLPTPLVLAAMGKHTAWCPLHSFHL